MAAPLIEFDDREGGILARWPTDSLIRTICCPFDEHTSKLCPAPVANIPISLVLPSV
jgi:hypothetical protein